MTPTTDVIHFTCHACGMVLTVPKDLAGISGPCPQCQAIITSPSFIETVKTVPQIVAAPKPAPVVSPVEVTKTAAVRLPVTETFAPPKPVPQTSLPASPWAQAPVVHAPVTQAPVPLAPLPSPPPPRIPALQLPPPQANFPILPKGADGSKHQTNVPSSSFSGNLPVAVPRPLPEPKPIIPPVIAASAPSVEDLHALPPQIKVVETSPIIAPTTHKTAVILPKVQAFQLPPPQKTIPQPREEEKVVPLASFPTAPPRENLPEVPSLDSELVTKLPVPKSALTTLPPKGAAIALPLPNSETSGEAGDQDVARERPLPQWSALSAAEKKAYGRPPTRGTAETPKKWGVFFLALAMILLVLACTAFFFQDSLKLAWSEYKLSKEAAEEVETEIPANVPSTAVETSPLNVVPTPPETSGAQTTPPPVVEVPMSIPQTSPEITTPDLGKPETSLPIPSTPSPAPIPAPDPAKPESAPLTPPTVSVPQTSPSPAAPALESPAASDLPKPMPSSAGMTEVQASEPAPTVLPAQLISATSNSSMAKELEEPRETMVEVPAIVPEPPKVEKTEEEYKIIIEAPPEVQAAVDVLKEFCAAATWQDRAKYVQFDRQMRPLMERYYEANPYRPLRLSYVSLIRHDQSTAAGAVPHCVFEISGSGLKQPTPVMIELTDQGWKVDWLSFTEFKDELLQRFMEDFVEVPARFRVLIRRAHFFGSKTLKTSDMESKNCFQVKSPVPGFSGYVFAPKSSEFTRELDANLGWNVKNAAVVVELKWRKEGSLQWVELVGLPQYNWRNPGPQVAKAEAVDDGPKTPSPKRPAKKQP